MVVTREVSQLEMFALKSPMPRKRELMSVTRETHQSAMGPYFLIAARAFESSSLTAARAFESNSLTAVFRDLSAKVKVQAGGNEQSPETHPAP